MATKTSTEPTESVAGPTVDMARGETTEQLDLARSANGDIPSSEGCLRQFCLRLVEQLPERGLPELFETLEQMVEFYTEEPPHVSFEPYVIETVTATIGRTYDRPVFQAEEE